MIATIIHTNIALPTQPTTRQSVHPPTHAPTNLNKIKERKGKKKKEEEREGKKKKEKESCPHSPRSCRNVCKDSR